MARTLLQDLRNRVVDAIDRGMSCRATAAHFGVNTSSAIRWRRLAPSAWPNSRPASRRGSAFRQDRSARRFHQRTGGRGGDITLVEVQVRLIKRGTPVGIGAVHHFFARHGIMRKKTGHAIEQDRPDVLRQQQRWFDGQLNLDPERLVFIDETWTATIMTRSHGRCPSGEQLRMGFPQALVALTAVEGFYERVVRGLPGPTGHHCLLLKIAPLWCMSHLPAEGGTANRHASKEVCKRDSGVASGLRYQARPVRRSEDHVGEMRVPTARPLKGVDKNGSLPSQAPDLCSGDSEHCMPSKLAPVRLGADDKRI